MRLILDIWRYKLSRVISPTLAVSLVNLPDTGSQFGKSNGIKPQQNTTKPGHIFWDAYFAIWGFSVKLSLGCMPNSSSSPAECIWACKFTDGVCTGWQICRTIHIRIMWCRITDAGPSSNFSKNYSTGWVLLFLDATMRYHENFMYTWSHSAGIIVILRRQENVLTYKYHGIYAIYNSTFSFE